MAYEPLYNLAPAYLSTLSEPFSHSTAASTGFFLLHKNTKLFLSRKLGTCSFFFFFLKNPAPWSSHNWFLRVIQISGQVSFLQRILWPLNWVCLPVIFYHIILFYFCHILLLIYILRCSLSLSPSLLCEFHKSLFVSESSATKTMALSCTQKYMFINILPLSNN